MKRILLLGTLLIFKICEAQYCGTSGTGVCSTNNLLTEPGLMDYHTFPCVHDSVPFDEVIQLLVPDRYVYFDTPVINLQIDSISNLPCGLCWQCDDPDKTYGPGSRGCIRISGTATEAKGVYPLKIYGRIQTPMGGFGLLDNPEFQFLLNVVNKNESCSPINSTHLSLACAPDDSNDSCNLMFEFKSTRPTVNCHFDSTGLYVSKPTGLHLGYRWEIVDKNFDFFEDSTSTIKMVDATAEYIWVEIFDSLSSCHYYENYSIIPGLGPEQIPEICYTTFDSTYGSQRGLQIVFEKNNWFQSISRYDVYLQFDPNQSDRLVGSIPSSSPGIITDSMPQGADIYFLLNPSISNYYSVLGYSDCLTPPYQFGGDFFNAPVVYVDSSGWSSDGFPSVYWMKSDPINYDRVFIFSRHPGGSWRTRMSTNDFSTYSWVDYHPDSTEMEYMVGFRLNVSCDPSRSAEKMAFTNFGSSTVAPEKVDTSSFEEASSVSSLDQQIHIHVFPNPASDNLQLQLDRAGSEDITYFIYDILGEKIKTGKVTQALTSLDISGLSEGVFMLSVYHDSEPLDNRRFLKK